MSSLPVIEMLCGIFRGKKYQIKIITRRLCTNILLSINNGDRFYSFDTDNDFRSPYQLCARTFPPDHIINSEYFINFIRQTGIMIRKYKGNFLIDYPTK